MHCRRLNGSMPNEKHKGHCVFNDMKEFRSYFNRELGKTHAPPVNIEWRGAQKGEWVYSDDARIVQILAVRPIAKRLLNPETRNYKDRKVGERLDGATRIVITIVGKFSDTPKTYMHTNFKLSKPYHITGRLEEALNKKQKLFAQYFVESGGNVKYAAEMVFVSPATASKFIKSKGVMMEVRNLVEKALKDLGIDAKYVIGGMKTTVESMDEIIEDPQQKKTRIDAASLKIDILSKLATMVGIKTDFDGGMQGQGYFQRGENSPLQIMGSDLDKFEEEVTSFETLETDDKSSAV